ncbi:MAG: hypothetical protein IJ867_07300 [Clostridia bacterium]|nr:hypothetical protein [Clostridia bacterium]
MLNLIKKYKFLFIVIIVAIILIIIASSRKNKKKSEVLNIDVRPASEIIAENNQNTKNKISNNLTENLEETTFSLQNFFVKVGMDLGRLDEYLVDFDFFVDYGITDDIEFYARDELNESIDFYDAEGNKIDIEKTLYNENEEKVNGAKGTIQGIPVPKDGENQIEISDDISNFKVGNYYLIKYYVPFSNYTYYFISRLSSTGFKDFNLYVISTNEIYKYYTMDFNLELEN